MYIQSSTIEDCGSYHNNLKLVTLPLATQLHEAKQHRVLRMLHVSCVASPSRDTTASRE